MFAVTLEATRQGYQQKEDDEEGGEHGGDQRLAAFQLNIGETAILVLEEISGAGREEGGVVGARGGSSAAVGSSVAGGSAVSSAVGCVMLAGQMEQYLGLLCATRIAFGIMQIDHQVRAGIATTD